MNTRRRFLGTRAAVAVPVAVVAAPSLPKLRIRVGPEPQRCASDIHAWLDGAEITRDIPIRYERRFRRARPGHVLTFTLYRRNAAGAHYLEGGKVACDVVRALVIA